MFTKFEHIKTLWWVKLGIFVGVVSISISVLIGVGMLLNYIFAVQELKQFDSSLPSVSEILSTLDNDKGLPLADDPLENVDETEEIALVGSYNFILIGNDYRPGREPACELCYAVHSDAFVYINLVLGENPQVKMVSFPRELFLHVDGIEPDSRINQLYARGGIEWIRLWSETILDIKIDGVVIINMDSFEQIIDELGGIDIVPSDTFRDKCGSSFYEYEKNVLYHLNGYDALCYARMRLYNPDGYFARQERHTQILFSIFDSVIDDFKEDPIVTSVKMVSLYYELIETDMSPEFIAKIISDIAINFLFGDYSWNGFNLSINADNLELYPRKDENSPYLYKPTFVISDWIKCIVSSDWPYDCELE